MKAKTKARARRGRPRKAGPRKPDGRLNQRHQAAQQGPVIPAEVIERRAEMVGMENAKDERAGTALGRLRLRGKITERQHDAGRRYAALYVRWARLAECPARHAKVARLPVASDNPFDAAPQVIDLLEHQRAEDADGQWVRAKERMARIEAELRRLPGYALAMALAESVCVDDFEPPEPWLTKCLPTLRAALTAMADHYRLEPDEVEVAA